VIKKALFYFYFGKNYKVVNIHCIIGCIGRNAGTTQRLGVAEGKTNSLKGILYFYKNNVFNKVFISYAKFEKNKRNIKLIVL
jgi:ABC-type uncharacterized transport system ATPase subunit